MLPVSRSVAFGILVFFLYNYISFLLFYTNITFPFVLRTVIKWASVIKFLVVRSILFLVVDVKGRLHPAKCIIIHNSDRETEIEVRHFSHLGANIAHSVTSHGVMQCYL